MRALNNLHETQPASYSLSSDERWKLVLRVVSSPEFRKSTRLRDFLLYICERALTDRLDEIHEQQIGSIVFERRTDFNPGEDNIVRVEARELRRRLAVYFTSDGKDEPLVIRIPKGSYVPLFESRTSAAPEVTAPSPLTTEQAAPQGLAPEKTVEELPARGGRIGLAVPLLAVLLMILLFSGVWQWRENQKLREDLRHASTPSLPQHSLWPRLFDPEHETYIVAADSCFVLIQDITHTEISLKDYLTRRYAEDLRTPELQIIASRRYTDLADVSVVGKILQATAGYRQRTTIRYARNLEIQDLKTHNLILLGGYRSNPWVEEFDRQRNFRGGLDKTTRTPYYLNKSPRPGEETRYVTRGRDGMWEETHGVITLLPNLGNSGNVLIIEGATAEGTEAAGDFITDPAFSSRLRQYLKLSSSDESFPYFELLLKIASLPGAPTRVEYATHRILSGQNR
jgi:hypothetical protein